jgi:DNA-binding XRE family transcriptional regulator
LTPQTLKRQRQELKLTQAELAKELSVSRNSVIGWEAGRHRIPGWMNYALAGLYAKQASMSKT